MSEIVINGGKVVYEILGTTGEFVVVTPGGRYDRNFQGIRPFAEALVALGYRVLIWDRPNCGESDVQFYGVTESHMRAEILNKLLAALGETQVILAGGSGGARESMLTVIENPSVARKLIVWNIVGGVYGTYNLGAHYILPSIRAVRAGGIEGVLAVPEWQERIAQNPANKERLLELGADEFLKVMLRWLNAYVLKPGQTVPGVDDWLFDRIEIPTLIIRNGESDLDHPKRMSLEVSCLIKGSEVVDPPWPEDAWAQYVIARGRGEQVSAFDQWYKAAPVIDAFVRA